MDCVGVCVDANVELAGARESLKLVDQIGVGGLQFGHAPVDGDEVGVVVEIVGL